MIVAIGEDGGGHRDLVAEDAAGGVTARNRPVADLFDDNATATFSRLHAQIQLSCSEFK